ncbi:HlyD family secretion protein [soil metagenome]
MNPYLAPTRRILFTLLIVVAAAFVLLWLWRHYEDDPWTRDGHVRADVVRVAPDVSGLVTQVFVKDNQTVHKGDLLFVVDLPRYSDALGQVDAKIASAKATLQQAQRVAKRDIALGDLVATETHEENVAKVATAQAALQQTVAARQTAVLDVSRTAVRASVNGKVTNLDLHPGDYVGEGKQAMALVDTDSLRVEGYFEETKLRHIRIGDKVHIQLMGDERPLIGHVDSIAGAIADDQIKDSGNLLLAVQPTFSWVRLAQRIPVRIHVDSMPVGTLLIPGRTATVTILADTVKPQPKAAPPAAVPQGKAK